MRPCCLIVLIVLSAVFSGAGSKHSAITVIPSVAVALVNDSTFFNCSTTSVNVEWLFGSDQYPELFIYSYGTVKPTYVDRFRAENYMNSFGNHSNLILQYVTKNDAGLYICRDPDDQAGKVNLTVIETRPVCESNLNVAGLIGPNSCSIKPDTVQLSCSVTYNGNQVPELQWSRIGDNMTINSSICSASGNVNTCYLRMETEIQMEGNSYICQTTQSRTTQYNCTSDVFRIIYVLSEHTEQRRTVDERVNCSVNSSSQSCNLSWIFDNGTTKWTESHGPVIEFKRPGRFICRANCIIRNDSCTFTAMTVNVDLPVSAGSQDNDNYTTRKVIAGIVVAAVVLVTVVGLIIYFCRRKKKRQNGQDVDKPDGTQLPMLSADEQNGGTVVEYIVPGKIEPKAEKNLGRKVRGLTILNDELFIAFKDSNIIEVFPITSRTQYRSFVVDGLMCPGTMAACARNSCLYVIDKIASYNKKIFKFRPNGEVLQTWNTDDDDYGRISVNGDGNVVMTVYDKHQMKIYSSDGKLLSKRTIHFKKRPGPPIAFICHVIKVTGGKFILSHGSYQSELHRVCKINSKGKVLRSFGNKKGSDDKQLSTPAYLVEGNDGSILVADQMNHRIIILNSELEFKTVLFTKEKDGVSLPEAMHVYKKAEPPLIFLGCNETVMVGGYVLVLRLEQ